MKAIVVKYFGPSSTKGARLRVSAEGVPNMTVSYDHGAHEPKLDAAKAFCRRHGWHENIQEGTLPNGDAVFVFLGERSAIVRNAEGLTIDEWLAAAGRTSINSKYDIRLAWRMGEDPTEYKNDD